MFYKTVHSNINTTTNNTKTCAALPPSQVVFLHYTKYDAEGNIILHRITVKDGECLYMFDPYDENIPQNDQSVKRYGGDSGLKILNSDDW